MAAGLDEMRRRMDAVSIPLDDRPWMKLTGEDSGDYAWTEQFFDATAGFTDRPAGRSGIVNGVGGETQTYSPAREMNGETVSAFPHYVRAERSVVTTEGPVYYFKATIDHTEFYFPTYTPRGSVGFVGPSGAIVGTLTFADKGKYIVWGSFSSSMGLITITGTSPYFIVSGITVSGSGGAFGLDRRFHLYPHNGVGSSTEITHITFGVTVTLAPLVINLNVSLNNLLSFSGSGTFFSETDAFKAMRFPPQFP